MCPPPFLQSAEQTAKSISALSQLEGEHTITQTGCRSHLLPSPLRAEQGSKQSCHSNFPLVIRPTTSNYVSQLTSASLPDWRRQAVSQASALKLLLPLRRDAVGCACNWVLGSAKPWAGERAGLAQTHSSPQGALWPVVSRAVRMGSSGGGPNACFLSSSKFCNPQPEVT